MDRLDVPVHRLRYEDFTQAPQASLASILEFAGMDGSGTPEIEPDKDFRLSGSHSVAGNPNRLDTTPLRLATDEAWRHKMSPNSQRLIETLAAPLLRRFRYGTRRQGDQQQGIVR